MAQRPEGAPLQGAKVTNRSSGESEPLKRRADESLSVRHLLSTQRRTRCEAWCEERERAADGDRAKRQAVGVLYLNRTTPGKQGRVCERSGMQESGANRSAAETNSLDRSSCQQKGPGAIVFCLPVYRRPRRTASPCSPPLRDRLPIISAQNPIFPNSKKNDPDNDPL